MGITARFIPMGLALSVTLGWTTSLVPDPSKRKGAGPLFRVYRDGSWGYMTRTGRIAIAPQFESARDFFHGLAAVRRVGKWGYIDERGNWVIHSRFDDARDFLEDLAPVRLAKVWGYIDTGGRFVIPA